MNYRNTRCYLNCEKHIFDGVGDFECPSLEPFDMDISGEPPTLIPFYCAKTDKEPEDKIVHFFIDDYQFERVWNNADIYLSVLQRFKAVLTPDFSMYTDFPHAIQIFNHYRKQWCGAYWQENYIDVIPTIGWIGKGDDSFCYDGIPRDSLVCISTVGSFAVPEHKRLWLEGYKRSLDILTPKKIIFYGKLYPEIEVPKGIEYTVAINVQMQRLSEIRDKRRAEAKAKRKEKK